MRRGIKIQVTYIYARTINSIRPIYSLIFAFFVRHLPIAPGACKKVDKAIT